MPNDRIVVDPARRLILEAHEEARRRNESFMPTPEELRQIMVAACAEAGGPEAWCDRLGCTPAVLKAVLEGRRQPAGPMLDTLGMEWLRKLGRYADPQLDRRAQTRQRLRLSDEFRSAERLTTGRILRDINRKAEAKMKAEAETAKAAPPPEQTKAAPAEVIPFPRRKAADDDDLNEILGRT